ncbi:PAS domain S-box protein [Yeosuana marina]|uniref:PAS domain S-box protein n=1 Tax=Yeosuana marina TaxID=1565536 RepID=UPI0030C7AC88
MRYDKLNKDELVSKIAKLEQDLIKSNNIIKELQSVEDIVNQQSSILKFINSMAIPSADKSTVGEFTKVLLKAVKDYTGANLATFSLYLPNKKELQLLHIEAEHGVLKTVLKTVGNKIAKTASPVDDETYALIIKSLVGTYNTFTEVTFGAIPKLIDKAIRITTGIDRLYPIAHVIEGELYGTTMLGFKKGQTSPSIELLESYAHLISVSLRRYNAEKALQDSEIKHRTYIEHAPFGIFIANDKGEYIDANLGAAELLGYTRDELLKLSIPDVLANEKNIDSFKKLKNEGKLSNEIKLKKKDGTIIIARIDAVPLTDNQFIAFHTDITERKKAEDALKESEEKFKETANLMPQIIFESDLNGNLTYVNENAFNLLGYPKDYSILDKSPLDFFTPESKQKAIENISRKLNGDQKNVTNQYKLVRKDGSTFPVLIYSTPINKEGKSIGLRGIIVDISEPKKIELELIKAKEKAEESKANITAIIEGTSDSIWAFNHNYELLYINNTFQQEFFKSFDVLLKPGMNLVEALPKPLQPFWIPRYDRVLNNEQYKIEDAVPTENGTLYIEVVFNPIIKNGKVIGGSCFGSNITSRKLAEIELHKAKEKAEEKEEKFKLLNRLTSEMLLLPDIESIYKFIAENLQKHYPNTIILTSSVDESNHESRLEIISGLNNSLLKKAIKVLGFNPVGRTYKLTEIHNDFFKSGNFIEFDGGLAEFSASELPAFTAKAIEKLISLHKIYTIGINKDDELLAAIHFFTFNEQVISDGNFIEVFVKPAGLVIQKKIDEQTLKIAKEKEAESKKRFKFLLENAPDGVAINDIDGRLIYASPNALRHFGYSENEIIGHFGHEFTHPDDLDIVYKAFDKIVSNPEQKATAKYRFRKKDGEYRWIETTFTNLLNNEIIKGFVLNFDDITEKKQALEELVIAKEKAEESDRLKSAFLANMSHEIRTPMNGILGFAELLKEPKLTGEQQKKYIDIIKKSGERMLNIINDIIDISKIESGQMKFVTKDSNINKQLEYIYTFFKPESETKGIQLVIKNSLPETKAIVQTDREKVFAILTNLVKNAIKFTDQGSIELGCKLNGEFIEFFVKDSGVGIPKNRQIAIFERFIQADIEDSRAFQGAGLGLAITKSYVEMLGGKIWLESEEGIGSTFYFTIPHNTKHSEETNVQNSILTNLEKERIRDLKILIADDDENSKLLISELVNRYSKEILFANDGFEAIETCKNNPDIDLILMDIKMPKINGYEAAKEIRKFNKDIIIISQTAFGLAKDREKALESGCNDYISKPIKKDSLLNLLEKYFN